MKRKIISPLLSITSGFLLPLLLVFSIYLLLRGHNEPGGGFVGGLVAASAFTLYAIANGVVPSRKKLVIEPRQIIAIGISVVLCSGLLSFIREKTFLTGMWFDFDVPVVGKLGTPLLFDTGVYLIVSGITLSIIFCLLEEE